MTTFPDVAREAIAQAVEEEMRQKVIAWLERLPRSRWDQGVVNIYDHEIATLFQQLGVEDPWEWHDRVHAKARKPTEPQVTPAPLNPDQLGMGGQADQLRRQLGKDSLQRPETRIFGKDARK